MGKLNDLTIRGWIRSGERFEGRSDGVGLVLTWRKDTASPFWKFRYRFAGKPRVMNLGSYSNLPLSAARQTAKELRPKVTLGHDVAGEKQEAKTVALAKIKAAQTVMSVAKLADEYFERMVLGKWRHPNIVRSRIEGDIKPNIGKLALENVEPRHIDAMLQTVVKRGEPTMSNHVLRWMRRMFDHALKRHMLRFNPAAAFDLSDPGGKEVARDARGKAACCRASASRPSASRWARSSTACRTSPPTTSAVPRARTWLRLVSIRMLPSAA